MKRDLKLLAGAILILLTLLGFNLVPSDHVEERMDSQEYVKEVQRVVRVIDGDTIELESGERVRYIGIDTPELHNSGQLPECYGKEAALKNAELVEGKEIRLVKDVSDRDGYDRLLRYVYVGEIFVNETLVSEGFARAATYPPDVAQSETFRAAEKAARSSSRGLWSGCSNEEVSILPDLGSCDIKGNISLSGEKIFHVRGCEYYEKTFIQESQGERWFCSVREASEAGWRQALNCP